MAEQPDQPIQIGDFLILRKLGQGGMGKVFLAKQLSLKREVALKMLKKDLAENPTALQRFRQEAEAVASINHPNIVQVYAVGEQNGIHYMALEYVEGRNLRDYLMKKGPPELPIALSILRQVSLALQRAHEVGLVHRDIKPENIMVTRKVEVKVADFGLSRFFSGETAATNLTQSGVTLGTPLYMSPEQVRGETTDHRSDIYSLGVTAFHLLAGEPPFQGKTAFDVTVQHVQKEPPSLASFRPDLPVDLCAMVHKMMAKKPDDRYQSAKEIVRDIARVREGISVSGTQPHSLSITQHAPFTTQTTESKQNFSFGSSLNITPPQPSLPWGKFALLGIGWLSLVGLAFATISYWPGSRNSENPVNSVAANNVPKLSERLVSTREFELKEKIANRSTSEDDVLESAIQLGLVYLQERRLDEAEMLYKDMQDKKLIKNIRDPERRFEVTGKLGLAIVMSHKDQAAESNKQILDALLPIGRRGLIPEKMAEKMEKLGEKVGRPPILTQYLLKHPEFSQALAEAIIRNAENGAKEPKLEWLTKPSSIAQG